MKLRLFRKKQQFIDKCETPKKKNKFFIKKRKKITKILLFFWNSKVKKEGLTYHAIFRAAPGTAPNSDRLECFRANLAILRLHLRSPH